MLSHEHGVCATRKVPLCRILTNKSAVLTWYVNAGPGSDELDTIYLPEEKTTLPQIEKTGADSAQIDHAHGLWFCGRQFTDTALVHADFGSGLSTLGLRLLVDRSVSVPDL